MCRRRERGVALLAAVGTTAVLSLIVLGLARTAAVDQARTARALAGLQADALVRSGVTAARALLALRPADDVDTLSASWARPSGRQPLGAGWVEVTVEDEARRIDLNAPELAPVFARLLAGLGLDRHLAAAIADWIDSDDDARPSGSERAAYLGLSPPRRPANAPLGTTGELALVRGVDPRVLTRLAPFVTVAGEHAVNPNTAPREILLAALDDPTLVDQVLAQRVTHPVALEELPPAARPMLTNRGQYYRVRARAAVATTERAADATLWAAGAGAPILRAWEPRTP